MGAKSIFPFKRLTQYFYFSCKQVTYLFSRNVKHGISILCMQITYIFSRNINLNYYVLIIQINYLFSKNINIIILFCAYKESSLNVHAKESFFPRKSNVTKHANSCFFQMVFYHIHYLLHDFQGIYHNRLFFSRKNNIIFDQEAINLFTQDAT